MIKFHTLHVRNFCSFKEQDIPLDKKGIILVLGDNKDESQADSNGSGKSLILEAFCWATWGETIRGESNDNLVNNKVNKNCVVSILFSKGDTTYKVVRHHKDKTHIKENDIELFINGKEETLSKMQETQLLINSIIGLDFEAFSYLTPGARLKVSQLTDKGFKELLENFTQLDLFEKALLKAKERRDSLKNNEKLILFSIESLNNRILALDEAIEAGNNQYIIDLDQQKSRLLRINEELSKLERIDPSLLEDELSFTESSYQHTKEYLHSLQKEYSAMCAEHNKDRTLYDLLAKFKSKKTDLISQIKKIYSLEGDCPTCLQVLDESHTSKVIPKLEKKLKNIEKNILLTEDSIRLKNDEHEAVISKKQNSINKEVEALNSHTNKLAELRLKISSAKERNKLIDSMEFNKEAFSQPIIKPMQTTLLTQKSSLEESLKKAKDELVSISKELEIAEFWVDAFSPKGLRSYVLKNVTPFINKRLNYYCTFLTGGSMQVSIRTEKLLKNGNIKDDFGIDSVFKNGSKTYKGCSEGEKARVDLVLSLALADLVQNWINVTIPIRFYDETFERVDQSGLNSIVSLLKQDQDKYDTIFVITHNTNFQNFFEEKIIVTKQNGESKLC